MQEPEENQVPRVSTYRMAGHLATAFTIFTALVWTTLSVAVPISPTMAAGPEAAHAARLLSRWAHPLAAVIGITAMSGCFVAGKVRGGVGGGVPPLSGHCCVAVGTGQLRTIPRACTVWQPRWQLQARAPALGGPSTEARPRCGACRTRGGHTTRGPT